MHDHEYLVARLTAIDREIQAMRREGPGSLGPSLKRAADGIGDALTVLILGAEINARRRRVVCQISPPSDDSCQAQEKESR